LENSPGSPSLKRTCEDITNSRDKELALMDRAQDAAGHNRMGEAIRYLKDVLQNNPTHKKAGQLIKQYSKQRSRSSMRVFIAALVIVVLGSGIWQYLQERESLQTTRTVLRQIHEAASLKEIHDFLQQTELAPLNKTLATQFFIFNTTEVKQASAELQRWSIINDGLDLAADHKYAEAQRIFTEQANLLIASKEHHFSQQLLSYAKNLRLVQLQNEAFVLIDASQWKKASEKFSEINSEIEKVPTPENWKAAESGIQEKINLLQKIVKGESFELTEHKQEAFSEYTSALTLQERQKLPGVDAWLEQKIKAVGFDRARFDALLKTAQACLKIRDWSGAETALRETATLNPSAEIKALQTMVSDALVCDKQEMSIVIPVKMMSGGNYSRQNIFCVDRYEWPNKKGSIPLSSMSFVQAKDECRKVGKRLCLAREWVEACMGDENNGWPYGKEPDPSACNTDSKAVIASGAASKCKNAIGIYDMSGNLAEWTEGGNSNANAQVNAVGGAFDSSARTSGCQDSLSHKQNGAATIGFRCCLTPKDTDVKP
jgi:hypothetical protein